MAWLMPRLRWKSH